MGSLTHQTVNYVKGAGAGIEKRVLDKIKALEHYVHCCVDTGKVAEFTLTANALGTGNWQTIPAAGYDVIPAPGPGQVNIIERMAVLVNVTTSLGGAGDGDFGIYQNTGGNPLATEVSAGGGAPITDRVQVSLPLAAAFGTDYLLNTAIVLDHTAAGAVAAIAAVGTAKIKIYYKTVSFS